MGDINKIEAGSSHLELAEQLGGKIITLSEEGIIHLSIGDIERAFYETSPIPTGNRKTFWTMKLMRKNHKCRLPRGFVRGTLYV